MDGLEARVVNALSEWDESVNRANSQNSSADSKAERLRPWDYNGFLRRLATFSSLTWFGKPKALEKEVCAAYGWENIGRDRIECVFCHEKISCGDGLDGKTTHDIQRALGDRHRSLCPWRRSFTNEELFCQILDKYNGRGCRNTYSSDGTYSQTDFNNSISEFEDFAERIRIVIDQAVGLE